MNISIDGRAATLYRGTGIGNYTYQLINNFNQIDFLNKYTILTPKDCNLDLNLKNNFSLTNSSGNPNNNFWDYIKTPNILEKNKYDIYHIPQNGIGMCENISCPSIITLHDIIPLKMPETVSPVFLKVFNEQLPTILNTTSSIITVSEFSKKDICEYFNYPEEKVYVTQLAAEEMYKPLDKHYCKKILKKRYSIDTDFILYVGGFSPRKNILGLIEAFNIVKNKTKKNLKLVIVGRHGFSYETYKKRTIELKLESSVIFPGFIKTDDMPYFYNASSMLVYPSFYEGFGLPVLEAMACATPVISSSLTSVPEVCGDASILINPSNIDDISSAILNIFNDKDLASSLIYRGLIHSSKFSWKKTAYNTLDAYENTLLSL